MANSPFDSKPTSGAVVFDQAELSTTKMLKILQKNKYVELISKSEAKMVDLKQQSVLWLVEAAGGVVCKDDKILMIYRNDCWDLPKGKLEKGEKIEDCAVREVSEECGLELEHIRREELITQTLHTYTMNGKQVIKRTWWYDMSYSGEQALTPQTIEGITQAQWLDELQAKQAIDQSYGTIKDVMDVYKEMKKPK
ncbi:MAG: NUDIX domain-containing protein [Rikenellaceae bacterium]